MTSVVSELAAFEDRDLLDRARAGDVDAYRQLFEQHRGAAYAFARRLGGPSHADDLVSEAFANVLSALQRDLGPTVSFRSYLFTSIRGIWANTVRKESRYDLVEGFETLPPEPLMVRDDPDSRFDNDAIGAAFRKLPERWQAVLWYSTVEELSHAEAGERLGIKANAVAALAFRAREGLRQAYLSQHLVASVEESCRRMAELLPAYARGSLDTRKRPALEQHLSVCSRCEAALADLTGVNEHLGALLLPVGLGLAGSGSGWAALGGPAASGRLARWGAGAKAAATAALCATVAAVCGSVVVLTGRAGNDDSAALVRATPPVAAIGPTRPDGPAVPGGTSSVPLEVGSGAVGAGAVEERSTGTGPDSSDRGDDPGVDGTGGRPGRRPGRRPAPAERPGATAPPTAATRPAPPAVVTPPAVTPEVPAVTTPGTGLGAVDLDEVTLSSLGLALLNVPLTNLRAGSAVTVAGSGLLSSLWQPGPGWTCAGSGTDSVTCRYDGPDLAADTIRFAVGWTDPVPLTVTVSQPDGTTAADGVAVVPVG